MDLGTHHIEWVIVLVLLAILIPSGSSWDGGAEEMVGTFIYGRVTENGTGIPLKSHWIEIVENQLEFHYYTYTDENGEYSVQVGGKGTYYVLVYDQTYWPVQMIVVMDRSEDRRVDFQMVRPEHDLYIRVHSYNERTFFEGAVVTLTDLNDTGRIVVGTTGRDGWLNITVGPGNYSVNGSWGVFTDHMGSIRIENNSYRMMNLELWPPRADMDSPNLFIKKVVDIPPNSMYVYSIGSDEMYFFHTQYQATSRVAMYGIPGYFIDNFWNWTINLSGTAANEPWPCYDVGIGPARGGGGSMDTWMVPYRIVFVNRENVSSTVTFTIRYEYGQFYELPEGYVLFVGDSDEEEKGTNGLLIFFPILFFVILVSIVVGVVILFVQGRERSEPPKRSGPVGAIWGPVKGRGQGQLRKPYRKGSS